MPTTHFRIDTATPRLCALRGDRAVALPALWLRERCQDAAHLDPQTRQRLFNPHQLPDDLALLGVEADGDARVWLSFSDGYRGRYELDALAAELDGRDRLPATRPWTAALDLDELRVDWAGLGSDTGLFRALATFLARGVLILQGVPTDRERILQAARRFGYLRDTNFGPYFEVYSRPVANDLAYGSHALAPHTDNPYREPVPGIQLLHCLVNETPGGLSTLADSLTAGAALADEDPEGFECLAKTPLQFRFRDAEEEFIEQRPMIRRDALGNMTGLHYSPRLDYMPLLDDATLRRIHRARRRLGELLTDARFELRFPLHAGELLLFDNSRIVHGRTAFDANRGRRHLQGCYIDIDEPRSRYRTLSRRLRGAHDTAELE